LWREPVVDLGTSRSNSWHCCYRSIFNGERLQEWILTERFERHRQPWTSEEIQKLKLLAGKGMALKAIAKAMTRSEESIKDRAKLDGIGIAKLR
jgi:DNA-binding NarL/FixJ family response regulator